MLTPEVIQQLYWFKKINVVIGIPVGSTHDFPRPVTLLGAHEQLIRLQLYLMPRDAFVAWSWYL